MTLALYDTWTRSVRPFEPLQPGRVGLYCCGPTVYDYAHIGNLRTYVFEDVLRRVLAENGYAVRHVSVHNRLENHFSSLKRIALHGYQLIQPGHPFGEQVRRERLRRFMPKPGRAGRFC
jgi:hypothetical protein